MSPNQEFEKAEESYYKGRVIPDEVVTTVTSVKTGPKSDYLTVEARHDVTLNGRKHTLALDWYLLSTKNGLKVDWSAGVGYNPVGFKSWAAGTDPTFTLRAEAQISDRYIANYEGEKFSEYSVKLMDKYGDRYDQFHGYIPKNSDVGKKIYEILKDGQRHQLIVTVERASLETTVVRIKELVSETWVK
jgi:hypothetical protein